MPCERPIVGVILCSSARRLSATRHLSRSATLKLHVEAGVEHVGRVMPACTKRPRARRSRRGGSEGDDVVLSRLGPLRTLRLDIATEAAEPVTCSANLVLNLSVSR